MNWRTLAGIIGGIVIAGLNVGVIALAMMEPDPYQAYEPAYLNGPDLAAELPPYIPPTTPPEPTPRTIGEPPRPLTEDEKAIVGTWVTEVDSRATKTALGANNVMLQLQPGQDLVSGVMDAVENDRHPPACVWLELFGDLSGFRNECAVQNGEPSALNRTDPFTGRTSPLGVGFRWEMADGEVQLTMDEPLTVEGPDGPLEVRQWHLERRADGRVHESFPEHDYELPVEYTWEIHPGAFL
ncbi:MAG: hypothetical protein AAGF12_38515 [Myxococcota bacterium]